MTRLRDLFRKLLDAEARVPPLRRPDYADAFDPLATDPRARDVEAAVRSLDEEGRAAAEEPASDDDATPREP